MIPVDSYDLLIDEINHRETNLVPTTVGILFVDYNFRNAREIVQPALKWLNQLSGDIINFYLPGYEKVSPKRGKHAEYCFENNNYKFYSQAFQDFCDEFFKKFNIKPIFSPTLVLFEYGYESLYNTPKILIDLTSELTDIKKVELIFKEIVQQAKKCPELWGHSNTLQFKGLMKGMPDILDHIIKHNYLKAISTTLSEIKRYKIQ